MANTILIKRGNKADLSSLTLLPGELGVALDTQELYVGDADGTVKMVKGGASGAVESANKLTVPRNIALSGDAIGSTSFDGSADATIAVTLANSGVTAGTYTKVTVDAKGRVTSAENMSATDLPTIEITNIEGLQTALDAKANATDLNELETTVEGKADKANSLAGYGITNAYTKTEVNGLLDAKADSTTVSSLETEVDGKANKATSLSGYGITDAYTKGEVDSKLGAKADASTVSTLQTTVAGKADSSTTLSGYGITDAYTKSEVDAKVSSVYKYKGSVENEAALPQSNQVIGDVYNLEDSGMNVAWDGKKWDKLGSSVDLSAYMTTETANSTFATITTVNGKADKATNLSGYGITDAYTKTEVDGLLDDKANAATTIAGYGITDAYTETEVNNLLSGKLGTSDVIDGGTF